MQWWRCWPETAIFLRGLRPMFTGKFSPTNSSYSLRLCNVLRFESRLKVISFITEYVIFFYSVYRILPIRRCQLPFSKPPPLQPIRKVVQAWNFSCRVLGWVNYGSSGRFWISRPWAEQWGGFGRTPGGKKSRIFFPEILIFFEWMS